MSCGGSRLSPRSVSGLNWSTPPPTTTGLSGRDQRAILKTAGALLKLLYPHWQMTDDELREVLLLACELRQRVREQLHLIAPGEYDKVQLGVRLLPSGAMTVPTLPDSSRMQRSTCPDACCGRSHWPGGGRRPRLHPPVRDAGDAGHRTHRSARLDPERHAGEHRSRRAVHSCQSTGTSASRRMAPEALTLPFWPPSWGSPEGRAIGRYRDRHGHRLRTHRTGQSATTSP